MLKNERLVTLVAKIGGTPADQDTKIMWNRGGVKSRTSIVSFDEATDTDSGEHAELRPSVRPSEIWLAQVLPKSWRI